MQWYLILGLDSCRDTWPLEITRATVSLQEAPSLKDCTLPYRYRVSPVFPLTTSGPELPKVNEAHLHMHFFSPATPFREIGRIAAKLPTTMLQCIWFSIGNPSVLTISEDEHYHEEVAAVFREKEIPQEHWILSHGKIHDIKTHIPSVSLGPNPLQYFPSYGILPLEIRAVVDDLVASLNTLFPSLTRIFAQDLPAFVSLAKNAGEILQELVYLFSPDRSSTVPPGFTNAEGAYAYVDQPNITVRLVNQRVDRLIQINSSLSYLSSQLNSGKPPILERRALIRRYSLLGTSAATKAIIRLARHIERAFSIAQVESVLSHSFAEPRSPPISNLFTREGHDATDWDSWNVSRFRPPNAIPQDPKVPYFSGRLGFRETEYSVSAAIQVLWSADSLDWSPITLTHELLHGHVRVLFSRLFAARPAKRRSETFASLYRSFARAMRQSSTEGMTTLESLRALILKYCCLVPEWGSLTSLPGEVFLLNGDEEGEYVQGNVRLYGPETVLQILEFEYRNICEIIVHVLDLHYFYGSRLAIYLPFVWESWSAVPEVAREVRQYVLRCLLAAASKTVGSPRERFEDSVDLCKQSLGDNQLYSGRKDSLIPEVLEYLSNQQEIEVLYEPFHAALLVVDFASRILFSRDIRGHILGDDRFLTIDEDPDSEETSVAYELSTLEFTDHPIASPVGFLLGRVQDNLSRDLASEEVERRAAWVLLALGAEDGGGDVQGV